MSGRAGVPRGGPARRMSCRAGAAAAMTSAGAFVERTTWDGERNEWGAGLGLRPRGSK